MQNGQKNVRLHLQSFYSFHNFSTLFLREGFESARSAHGPKCIHSPHLGKSGSRFAKVRYSHEKAYGTLTHFDSFVIHNRNLPFQSINRSVSLSLWVKLRRKCTHKDSRGYLRILQLSVLRYADLLCFLASFLGRTRTSLEAQLPVCCTRKQRWLSD